MSGKNLVWHQATVSREARQRQNGHKSAIVWFTGLSGSGKSTLAHAVEDRLHKIGCRTFVLDGDNVRHGLCSDLTFSNRDREENIRRVGEAAKLFLEGGVIVLTAFISPFRSDRERVRNLVLHGDFMEVFCKCSLEICERRDVKGMYKKAREGKIPEFTGISSPYEEPLNPELSLETGNLSVEESVSRVIDMLTERGVINIPS
ncbi:MAG: adenylyl-sulfate kinase [Nitrospinae bacterium]|nr:adenylyl-sulfate kinase [Nitrospinota bacterium]MBF0635102.1 adenylyl-sulfate kinase [Nitrospinota bacterium]